MSDSEIFFQSKPPSASQVAASAKKAAAANVSGKKKKQQRKTSARQSGGQASQPVQEQVAGAIQDDTIDPDEETYCLCGQVRNLIRRLNCERKIIIFLFRFLMAR